MSDDSRGKGFATLAATAFCLLAALGCVVLIYTLGSLNGKQAERRQASPHSHAEIAKVAAKERCAKAEPASVFDCMYDSVAASEETARTEQDLTAQQRAAWAAVAAALLTFVSIPIGIGGLWALLRTIEQGRQTLAEASKANEIARKSAHLEHRPWIVVNVLPDRKLSFLTRTHTVVRIDLTNIGKQPAFNVATWATLFVDDFMNVDTRSAVLGDLMLRVGFHRAKAVDHQISRVIMPGQTISIRPDVTCDTVERMIGRIIAYAQYLSHDGETEHHTIAGFDLTSFHEDGSSRAIIASEGDLPQDRLRIEPNGYGEAI